MRRFLFSTATLAVATLAAMFTAGFAIGHRPEPGAAAHTAAAVPPAPAGTSTPVRDPSLPDAADVIGVPTTTEEPTSTF
jgi:hypothetical protein